MTRKSPFRALLACAVTASALLPSLALAQPSTRPGDLSIDTRLARENNVPLRPGPRLRAAIQKADPAPEQREQIARIVTELRRNIRKLTADTESSDPAFRREELRTLTMGAVDEIGQVLSSEQRKCFLDELAREPARARSETRPASPSTRPADGDGMMATMGGDEAGDDMNDMSMEGPGSDRPSRNRAGEEDGPRSLFLARLTSPEGATVGETLPGDLALHMLNKRERKLSTLLAKQRPTVIVLGSISSPSFRDRLVDLPWLVREIGRSSEVLVVYTREQHPAGGAWRAARNEEEQIRIPAHNELADRIALAERIREADGMDDVTVVVDAMDDRLLETLLGEEGLERSHNVAVVVSPEGEVLARQDWFDPSGIPAILERLKRN